jgi:endonuclease YncB( thermonuclease family)
MRGGKYGRLCGTLKARGQDVGATLVAEGLARAYVCGRMSGREAAAYAGVLPPADP